MKPSHIGELNIIISIFIYNWFAVTVVDAKPFTLYWNIPSFMCHRFNLPPINVTEKYGIVQNENDAFRGSAVSILYDPGEFPALYEDKLSGELVERNGGVPQQGNLNAHLAMFRKHVDELIPDAKYNGLAIIDFESWRPVYRQNFIECSIKTAKEMRPHAKWGYYGLPYCFNGRGASIEECTNKVKAENIRTRIQSYDRVKMVRGRVRESIRLANRARGTQKPQVIAYYRYLTSDRKFLSRKHTYQAINAVKRLGGDGVILWGSSFDLNSKSKCLQFYDYVENVLGPIAQSFQPRFLFNEFEWDR